jgi:hypothetical protein
VRSDGGDLAIKRFVPTRIAQQLINGNHVAITYIDNDPELIFFAGEEPESPWIWLIVGVTCMATFGYAWKLIKRKARSSEVSA